MINSLLIDWFKDTIDQDIEMLLVFRKFHHTQHWGVQGNSGYLFLRVRSSCQSPYRTLLKENMYIAEKLLQITLQNYLNVCLKLCILNILSVFLSICMYIFAGGQRELLL